MLQFGAYHIFEGCHQGPVFSPALLCHSQQHKPSHDKIPIKIRPRTELPLTSILPFQLLTIPLSQPLSVDPSSQFNDLLLRLRLRLLPKISRTLESTSIGTSLVATFT